MDETLKKFPFLTVARYLDQEYVGIVGNSDAQITSIYVYSLLPSDVLKKLYLQLGEEWWWETNRQLPINVSIKERWTVFRSYLKTFITKDLTIMSGPTVSLDSVITKRVKRRQITLIKKI